MPTSDDIEVSDNLESTIRTIREYTEDIEATEQKVKTLREQVADHVQSFAEYDEVKEAKAVLAEAQTKLRHALLADKEYNAMAENLADERAKLNDAKQIRSDYLVAYFAQTKERQVPLTNRVARKLIVSGKLGKEETYQPSLFSGLNVEVTAGGVEAKVP